MDPSLKLGVVGVGKMGELHLQKAIDIPKAKAVGFFEPNFERAKHVSQKYGVESFSNLAALLMQCEAVVIASPTSTHYELSKAAFELGVHVLVEKPVTEELWQAEKLIKLAEAHGLTFQVGFLERFRVSRLGVFNDRPNKIQLSRMTTNIGRESDLDVISDLMIHDLDLVLNLMGEDPVNVDGSGEVVVTELLDSAEVDLTFPSGTAAHLSASRVAERAKREIRLHFSDHELVIDLQSNEIARVSQSSVEKQSAIQLDPLLDQLSHFCLCSLDRKMPDVSGEDGLNAMRLANQVRSALGRAVTDKRKPTDLPTQVLSQES